MSKFALITLCLIALLSGLGWAVLSQESLLVTAAVVAVSLSLAALSWRLGQ